ncbi:MAG: 30S ribosomal protein S6 [Rhodospirillales bacterium]
MPCYESVFIARQDISASQAEGLTENFSQIIANNGGTVVGTESWGLRSIAYRIKKNRKGHYVLMNIDAPAPAVHEMERQMRIHEDVLRYMTIRVDEIEEGPSAMLRNKDRDDRPRRGDRGSRYEESDKGPKEDKDSKEGDKE